MHGKADHFAHFVKIELLVHVSLECITDDEIIGAIKGARTYCIINERDQSAAKDCNRKLCYRKKLEKLFCASENETLTVSTTHVPLHIEHV